MGRLQSPGKQLNRLGRLQLPVKQLYRQIDCNPLVNNFIDG